MSNSLPKISIITPSLNQGEFIERTIQSVLNQGYPDLEYIIIDGGSTDSTPDILRNYGDRISWISEPDRGQSHAINKGLRKASGQVLAFLNSDDIYLPGALLKVGRHFLQNPESAWLTGKCRNIDQNGFEIRKAITQYKNFWLLIRSYQVLLVMDYISQPPTFWHRRALDKVGFLNEGLQYAMDYDYWLRIGRHFKLDYIDSYLACFRVHPLSKAGSSANNQFDALYKIAKSHSSSRILLNLHAFHNYLIISVYHKLLGIEKTSSIVRANQEI
jgi:glycosyltransferase involved in cell wall biosynthesis